jgi:UDP-glucose 4-epimerase
MSNCLVTGGAGFIGSHLVEALLANGHEVRVLDNFSTGSLANLASVGSHIELRTGDILDLEAVRDSMQDIETVFHLAANPSVMHSLSNPIETHQACATGTLHVLIAAREARVQRVIYSGSASCYGDKPKDEGGRIKDEQMQRPPSSFVTQTSSFQETEPPSPVSPYGVAMLAGEHYCLAFTSVYGLETVRLRCFNVFGPRQAPSGPNAGIIPLLLRAGLCEQRPIVYGDGLQVRDYVDVDDVVQANLLAAEAPRVSGRVYNIGTGQGTAILGLIKIIGLLLGCDLRPIHAPARPGEIKYSRADISRAQADLGYCPWTDLERGLRRCLDFYSQRRMPAAQLTQSASRVG